MERELKRGTLEMVLLKLLREREMYGYEIVTTVREETNGTLEWKEGSLYPALHKLESSGLIRSRWQGKPGSRRRKYYQLTPAGLAALDEKTRSWSQLCRTINQVLEKFDG